MLIDGVSVNSEDLLAVLPDNKDEAMSQKEITLALCQDSTSSIAMERKRRQIARALKSLIKWGWVVCDRRPGENGHEAFHNSYWKTDLAKDSGQNRL